MRVCKLNKYMLQNHTTSLELSKQLKVAGCPQESEFYWADDFINPFVFPATEKEKWQNSISDTGYFRIYSAYLSSEIGEMWKKKNIDEPLPHIGQDGWYWYKGEQLKKEKTEADCRAKMLLFLIKEGIVKF